jgi:dihydroorotate dehydrogenase
MAAIRIPSTYFRQNSLIRSLRHVQLSSRTSRALRERQLQLPLRSTRRGYASSAATDARSFSTRLKNLFLGTAISASLILGYFYVTDTRAGVHQWLVVPALRWLYPDAEDAHEAGTRALRALYSFGLHPRERTGPDKDNGLQIEVGNYPRCCV